MYTRLFETLRQFVSSAPDLSDPIHCIAVDATTLLLREHGFHEAAFWLDEDDYGDALRAFLNDLPARLDDAEQRLRAIVEG